MNRSLVVGLGVTAVAVLVGLAAWLLLGGKPTTTPSDQPTEAQGPLALNLVTVVTDHAPSETEDGRKLTITFTNFELSAKSGQTTSAVFSTTWRLKLGADERALVTSARLAGFMKSAEPTPAAPPPTPEPTVSSATPAEAPTTTTPATDGSAAAQPPATPSTTLPSQPAAPAAAPKAIAGDGVARVIVTLGNETYVTEWTDTTGEGASRKIAKASALTEAPIDYRNGSTIPVSVTLELSGGHEADAQAKIDSLELQLFAESAPLGQPPMEPAPTDTTTPPADPTTTTPPTP